MSQQFRAIRRPLSLTFRGWSIGRDPRRNGGISLVSPRGTVFEMLVLRGLVLARRFVRND